MEQLSRKTHIKIYGYESSFFTFMELVAHFGTGLSTVWEKNSASATSRRYQRNFQIYLIALCDSVLVRKCSSVTKYLFATPWSISLQSRTSCIAPLRYIGGKAFNLISSKLRSRCPI